MGDYTLKFLNSFDTVNSSSFEFFACGKPGNIAGLDHFFHHSAFIADIPHLQFVEIPITFADTGLCLTYSKIVLQIIATCEMKNQKSEVYQYGEELNPLTGELNINYNIRRAAENSTVIIDEISWVRSSTTMTVEGSNEFLDTYYSASAENLGGGSTTVQDVDFGKVKISEVTNQYNCTLYFYFTSIVGDTSVDPFGTNSLGCREKSHT